MNEVKSGTAAFLILLRLLQPKMVDFCSCNGEQFGAIVVQCGMRNIQKKKILPIFTDGYLDKNVTPFS